MVGFSVDTKLFRELGELLVGRESTALVELIKNAYDADATSVVVFGQDIAEPNGSIVVSDNGIGMSEQEFKKGFLTIAGRSKVEASRRSPWFQRRFTGEKGVGRLAAHKLARVINVETFRWNGNERSEELGFPADEGLNANINWDTIEALSTIDQIDKSDAIKIRSLKAGKRLAGTTLTLSPLRKQWSDRDREQFLTEVATLTPAEVLVGPLNPQILTAAPLFEELKVRDEGRPGGFKLEYSGDLALSESELPAAAEGASWIIEVDCDKAKCLLRISVIPTKKVQAEFPIAEPYYLERELSADDPVVSFQARLLQRSLAQWPRRYQGVRVYYEGFRVLPYGDAGDDWLGLDRDYRSRGHAELGRLKRLSDWNLPEGSDKELLAIQGNTAIFGGVMLTRSGAEELEMLVNREGFLPGPHLDFITDTIRLAIDLQVRLRYATTSEVKQARQANQKRQLRAAERAPTNKAPSALNLRELHDVAKTSLDNVRLAISAGHSKEAIEQLVQLETSLKSAAEIGDEVISEATMFRVLAALGLEHSAFLHEVRSLSLSAQSLGEAIESIAKQTKDPAFRKQLQRIAADAHELRERLRRNAVYISDVTGIEGRRRRSRQALRERVERVIGFFANAINERKGTVTIDVPKNLQTPPLFPAELVAILSNLLSNAVKFMGKAGQIRVAAEAKDGRFYLRVENTGEAVNLESRARWFEPFRSTTADVDEALGQGMGLGLTITRSLIDEYGGNIDFVTPSDGFATAVEVEFPRV